MNSREGGWAWLGGRDCVWSTCQGAALLRALRRKRQLLLSNVVGIPTHVALTLRVQPDEADATAGCTVVLDHDVNPNRHGPSRHAVARFVRRLSLGRPAMLPPMHVMHHSAASVAQLLWRWQGLEAALLLAEHDGRVRLSYFEDGLWLPLSEVVVLDDTGCGLLSVASLIGNQLLWAEESERGVAVRARELWLNLQSKALTVGCAATVMELPPLVVAKLLPANSGAWIISEESPEDAASSIVYLCFATGRLLAAEIPAQGFFATHPLSSELIVLQGPSKVLTVFSPPGKAGGGVRRTRLGVLRDTAEGNDRAKQIVDFVVHARTCAVLTAVTCEFYDLASCTLIHCTALSDWNSRVDETPGTHRFWSMRGLSAGLVGLFTPSSRVWLVNSHASNCKSSILHSEESEGVSEAVLAKCPKLREAFAQLAHDKPAKLSPSEADANRLPAHEDSARAMVRSMAGAEPLSLDAPVNPDEWLRALDIPLTRALVELDSTASADWAPLLFLVSPPTSAARSRGETCARACLPPLARRHRFVLSPMIRTTSTSRHFAGCSTRRRRRSCRDLCDVSLG